MIPIKKSNPEEVKKFCKEIYDSINENKREELDKLVHNNFKLVVNCETKDKAFLNLMMLKYDELKELKEEIDKSKDKTFSTTIKIDLSSREKFLSQIHSFINISIIKECNDWLKENKIGQIEGVVEEIDLKRIMTYTNPNNLKLIRKYVIDNAIPISDSIEKILQRFEQEEEYINLIYEHLDNDFKDVLDKWLREKSKDSVNIKVLLKHKNQKSFEELCPGSRFETEEELKYNITLKKYFQIEWKSKLESYYNKIDKKRIVRITGVTVCPYCNRNFINVTEEANTSQLDHFFSKSEYPLFALCFYNLIPSCYGCNNKKRNNKFVISPYDGSIGDINSLLTFSYEVNNADFTSKDGINVTMKYNEEKEGANDLKDAQELLDLSSLYELHSDIVQELLWKKSVYTESYQANLNQILKVKPLSKDELGRIITGVYTNKEDYGKRPLSKMITEISKEIGLIGEDE